MVFEMQAFRFRHWLAEKTDYKESFRGKPSAAFECKPSTVAAAPAGPDGQELQVEVTFEPSSIGDNYHETLVVSSAAGGEYECQVSGRCLPPKPSGPYEVVKVCLQPACCCEAAACAQPQLLILSNVFNELLKMALVKQYT